MNSKQTRHRRFSNIVLIIVGLLIGCLLTLAFLATSRDAIWLKGEHGADWIRHPDPVELKGRGTGLAARWYKCEFEIDTAPEEAVLHFRALRRAVVFFDGRRIFETPPQPDPWDRLYAVDLAPMLSPGPHEIRLQIINRDGPPVLIAFADSLGLATDETWKSSKTGGEWENALRVRAYRPASISRQFMRADQALWSLRYYLAALFALGMFLTWGLHRKTDGNRINAALPGNVRWILMGLWTILMVNNLLKIPLDIGMDLDAHLENIRYMAEHLRPPLPSEGRQLGRAPFYFAVSALFYKGVALFLSLDAVFRALRIIPMLCGLLQIEICYRVLRTVYPKRPDIQVPALVMAAFLPMNFYMSQMPGNETLAGVWVGLALVMVLSRTQSGETPSRGWLAWLGLCLGLAMLTKETALLAMAAVGAWTALLLYRRPDKSGRLVRTITGVSLLMTVALAVCGWHYVRFYLDAGRLYLGGQNPSGKFDFWQDPGVRIAEHFFRFGEAMMYPAYASVAGFWDSLYSTMWFDGFLSGMSEYAWRPPWNYTWLLAAVWLGLAPCACMLAGAISAVKNARKPDQKGALFCAACVLLYFAAILHHYIGMPYLTAGKASYLMGVLPCLAVMAAAGWSLLDQTPRIRRVLTALVFSWAMVVYIGFWIAPERDKGRDRFYLGEFMNVQGNLPEAIDDYRAAVKLAPDHTGYRNALGVALARGGRSNEAEEAFRQALTNQPDFAEALYNLGRIDLQNRRFREASSGFEKALTLKPDSAEIHNNLGVALEELGEMARAAGHYAAAAALDLEMSEPEHNLARVLEKMLGTAEAMEREQQYEDALAMYRSVIVYHHFEGEADYHAARLLARLSRNRESLEMLKSAIENGFADRGRVRGDQEWRVFEDQAEFEEIVGRLR